MILKRLTVGRLSTNCYILGCPKTKEALIIDPGFDREKEAEKVLKEVDQHGLKVQYIVNTHGHPDHVSGNGIIKGPTGASILIHEEDAPMLTAALVGFPICIYVSPPADKSLQDNDVIRIGEVVLTVLHTPGHSRGSICLLGEDAVFTGDTLFASSIGRTDLPGSSHQEILRSLKNKLMPLPDHLRIYPGHGLSSTVGREKRFNPFLSSLI